MTVDFTTKKTAKVYLPAGTVWYDFWTNEKYDGGQEISRETTIDMIPLYVRAGSSHRPRCAICDRKNLG